MPVGPPGGPQMGMPPPGFGGPPPGYGGPPPFGMPPPGFPFPGGFPPPWATGPMGPQQPPTISAPPMSAMPHPMNQQEDPSLTQVRNLFSNFCFLLLDKESKAIIVNI